MSSPADPLLPPAGARPGPRPVPAAYRFRFDGVRLVGGPDQLPDDPYGFAVVFDGDGVEVTGAGPAQRLFVPWAEVASVSMGPVAVDADGKEQTPVDIVSVGGPVRLLVGASSSGSVQLAGLEPWLAARPGVAWSRSLPAAAPSPVATPFAPTPPLLAPPPLAPPPLAPPPQWPAPSWAPARTGVPRPGAPAYPAPPGYPGSASRPGRTRRWAMLVGGLVLIVAGVGLAVGLSRHPGRPLASASAAPRPAPDQRTAQALMLTQSDLPHGWRVDTVGDQSGSSGGLRTGEAAITRTFAACMDISDGQAGMVLGGQAGNQTAQVASPVFVGPASASQPGFFMELQTAATIVRTHRDEESDFSLFSRPRYLGCAGRAVASELQLGEDEASGTHGRPGPTTVLPVTLPAPAGEQLSGLVVTFTISDQSNSVPVEVESISLGSDRIEADLQVFAIGGRIPAGVVPESVARFEERVAVSGRSAQV